jgi:hypothetical protein
MPVLLMTAATWVVSGLNTSALAGAVLSTL